MPESNGEASNTISGTFEKYKTTVKQSGKDLFERSSLIANWGSGAILAKPVLLSFYQTDLFTHVVFVRRQDSLSLIVHFH